MHPSAHNDRPIKQRTCARALVLLLTGVLGVTGVLGAGAPALAQEAPPAAQAQAEALIEQGRRAIERRRYPEAIAPLRAVVLADPLARESREQPTASYWLGKVYAELGNAAVARSEWRRGIEAGLAHGVLDVRAADAFIQSAHGEEGGGAYDVASAYALLILSLWGMPLGEEEQTIVERYAEQSLLLLAEREREDLRASENRGPELTEWWGRRDPFPATAHNERLGEHLARVAYAGSAFPDRTSSTGFDARGAVYVRLGEPTRRRAIDYFMPNLVRRMHELRTAGGNSLLVTPSSFTDGEFWFYEAEQTYHFLFVKRGQGFRLGEVSDLIPMHLRSALDSQSGRGGAKSDILLEVFRTIYEQLAPYDLNYVQRLYDVEMYLGQLEDIAQQEAAESADRGIANAFRRADYAAAAQRRGATLVGPSSPDLAARSFMETARREDDALRRDRARRAPQSRSELLDTIEPLGVASRVARFLDRDGSTRAEVYWAPEAAALPLSGALGQAAREQGLQGRYPDFALRATLVRNAARQDRHVERVYYHSVAARELRLLDPLEAQTLVMEGLRPGDDLAVQWDQLLAARGPDSLALGPLARVAVLRTEAFEPLHGDGRLEMSDLKPIITPTEEPYPFRSVEPTMPLALYFEAYGLSFGPRDEVDFAVEYEITLHRDGGLLRRGRQETTEGELVSTIRGTRTEQFLILNPGSWAGAQAADITVLVRDRSTGQTVRRTIRFQIEE